MLLFSHVTCLHRLYLSLLLLLIWLLWALTTPLLTVSIWTSTIGGNSHHSTQTSHANTQQNTPFRSYTHWIENTIEKEQLCLLKRLKSFSLLPRDIHLNPSQCETNMMPQTNCSVCKIKETENYHSKQTKMTTATCQTNHHLMQHFH